jgi:hypothetical protein
MLITTANLLHFCSRDAVELQYLLRLQYLLQFHKGWLDAFIQYITINELFPIVLLLELWGAKLQNEKIRFFTDDIAVVQIINKQSSKKKSLM